MFIVYLYNGYFGPFRSRSSHTYFSKLAAIRWQVHLHFVGGLALVHLVCVGALGAWADPGLYRVQNNLHRGFNFSKNHNPPFFSINDIFPQVPYNLGANVSFSHSKVKVFTPCRFSHFSSLFPRFSHFPKKNPWLA